MDLTKFDGLLDENQSLLIQNRVELNKVIIDTPALLNMIKHCQDSEDINVSASSDHARGMLMGVLKKEHGENNIFITQTLPEAGKGMMKDLKSII